MKLSDIIELSDVKLVIDLDDAERDPDTISETFILTDEVERGLRSILKRIDEQKGCGVFIKGNFGSGKSHFLSFLYLLLKDKNHPLLKDYKRLIETDINLIKISLVRYPSSLSLEGLLLRLLNYEGKVTDREKLYRELFRSPTVIIIDELSEFLRSKPSPPQFYEDVRFLQFLGEFSMRHPLWVVASLQEWIEETGHISSSIFNRIKDRYPLRINLTSSHIDDIIDQRLVRKKANALEVLKDVYGGLKKHYPNLELSLERFKKTYPLHPFTVRFLSGLTRIFSQHRGVIQFAQQEVLKRLEEPPDSLITPPAIFDYFEDRLREIPEYSAFVRTVYEYYRNNLPSIFNNPFQRDVARDIIKILILTELSPLEKRKTAKDLAEILLKKISTVKEGINYDYIKKGILETLVAHQMYIMKEGETYFVDISQDEGLRIKGRIKAIREKFSDRNYLFSVLADIVSLPYLPLKDIKDGKHYRFNWQNSIRESIVLLSHGLDRNDMERFVDGVRKRVDGYLVILTPFSRFALSPKLFSDTPELSSILIWEPREFTEEEIFFIEEYLAKTMLLNEFPSLKGSLRTSEPLFRDTITKVYFDGKVLSADGREFVPISEIGYLPMERLLSHLMDAPLKRLYPDHQKIMPRIDIYTSHHVSSLFNQMIKKGRITIEEAEKRGLVPYIKGLLEPLGIVIKKGTSYTLHISPDNDLISSILELLNHEQDLYKIILNLKRSRWGLKDDQINLLLSSLIVSGYAVPWVRQGHCDFRDLSQLWQGEIISLKPGRAIDPELLRVLPRGRFLWGEIETTPGQGTIKEMWKSAMGFIRRFRRLLEDLQAMINRYREYSIFKLINLDMPTLNRLSMFVHSISLNISHQEGIERFLIFLKENEDLETQIAYIERLYRFFDEEFPLINKYYLYLTHPSLKTLEDLDKERESLVREIEEALKDLSDLEDIRRKWTGFYDAYCSLYKDRHERFYSQRVFNIKAQVEGSQTVRTLKRIAYTVSSITFPNEWWDIKRRIEGLPERCSADLNQELFLNPLCSCGFQIDMQPPDSLGSTKGAPKRASQKDQGSLDEAEVDLVGLSEEGLRNFIKTVQLPENREKIDSTITGLTLSGKKDIAERLLQVLNIDPDRASINQIVFLLDEGVLQEIEKAFKGRWLIKEVMIEDLLERIKGRRFRYEELKKIILNWLGSDTDSIIHVKGMDAEEMIAEELSIYGAEGRKAQMELLSADTLDDDSYIKAFDSINLRSFETSQLIGFLKRERKNHMLKRLRTELFERFWNSEGGIPDPEDLADIDNVMTGLLKAIRIIKGFETSTVTSTPRGIKGFTDLLAPLSNILEEISYRNLDHKLIDYEILERLKRISSSLFRDYERRPDRYEGAKDIAYIKERLSGNVIIMDGLRYDLWLILKEVLIYEGWRIKDEVLRIDYPSTTSKFRDALGIEDDEGMIGGRQYRLLKVAEREIGKRNLRRFLKEGPEIRFFHFNFIDTRLHGSTLDLYPLYEIIKKEFLTGIVPILKEIGEFYLLSDHGFIDTKELKERYRHGGKSIWETALPFAEIRT